MKKNRYHDTARKAIIREKTALEEMQKQLKRLISTLCRNDPYGGPASEMMKRSNKVRLQINDLELSLKLLKQDAQRRIEQDWKQEQGARLLKAEGKRLRSEGSYNCLGGC